MKGLVIRGMRMPSEGQYIVLSENITGELYGKLSPARTGGLEPDDWCRIVPYDIDSGEIVSLLGIEEAHNVISSHMKEALELEKKMTLDKLEEERLALAKLEKQIALVDTMLKVIETEEEAQNESLS